MAPVCRDKREAAVALARLGWHPDRIASALGISERSVRRLAEADRRYRLSVRRAAERLGVAS